MALTRNEEQLEAEVARLRRQLEKAEQEQHVRDDKALRLSSEVARLRRENTAFRNLLREALPFIEYSGYTSQTGIHQRIASALRDGASADEKAFRLAQEKEILLTTLARAYVRHVAAVETALDEMLDVDEDDRASAREFPSELMEVFAHFDYDEARVTRVGNMARVTLPVKPTRTEKGND